MTVSLPPITAILSIHITQPFSYQLRGDALALAGEYHSDSGNLALSGGKIGYKSLGAVADELCRAEIRVHRVVACKLKGGHASAGNGFRTECGGLFKPGACIERGNTVLVACGGYT